MPQRLPTSGIVNVDNTSAINLGQCNNQEQGRVATDRIQCWISVEFILGNHPGRQDRDGHCKRWQQRHGQGRALTGTAVGPLTIKPSTNDFGTVVVNEASTTTVTLKVMNWSTTNTLGPVTASLTGNAGDFPPGLRYLH